MNILVLGAGAVGRGLIAPLLVKQHRVTFYDPNVDLRQETEKCAYPMIDAPAAEWQWVKPYYTFRGLELLDTVFVAVRVENLPSVGKWLIGHYPHFISETQIVVCENTPNAAEQLRDVTMIPELAKPRGHMNWHFVNAIAECIIPEPTLEMKAQHPLLTYHDPRGYLVVDAKAWQGERIEGLAYEDNFALAWDLKWYCHCGLHALVAYLGIAAGHTYIHEAIADGSILSEVVEVMEQVRRCLIKQYGDNRRIYLRVWDEFDALRDATRPDPCLRVGRDAARKVQPGERLDALRQLIGDNATVERAIAIARWM